MGWQTTRIIQQSDKKKECVFFKVDFLLEFLKFLAGCVCAPDSKINDPLLKGTHVDFLHLLIAEYDGCDPNADTCYWTADQVAVEKAESEKAQNKKAGM